MDVKELLACLIVWRLPGVGPRLFQQLKQHVGHLDKLFSMDRSQLLLTGMSEKTASVLKNLEYGMFCNKVNYSGSCKNTNLLIEGVKQDLIWLEHDGHHLLVIDNPQYPEYLKEIHTPPPLLFVKGNPEILNDFQIGIVGSRNASRIGTDNTRSFTKHLVEQGFTITSGLALGIDGVAHQAALDSGGKTIAVVANGLDQVYPKRHIKLAREIVDSGGALISEFPCAVQPRPQYFPRRNRIISGMSQGVLVIEAALKSGSLITARYAMEQGREVFAIPGSIHNPLSKGCHSLIKQGAALVETGEDILSELQLRGIEIETLQRHETCVLENKTSGVEANPAHLKNVPENNETEQRLKGPEFGGELKDIEEKIIKAMGYEVVTLDFLVEHTGADASILASALIMLELQNKIIQEVGGYTLAKEWAL